MTATPAPAKLRGCAVVDGTRPVLGRARDQMGVEPGRGRGPGTGTHQVVFWFLSCTSTGVV